MRALVDVHSSDAERTPRNRIIYLRDFGAIARDALPFLAELLIAIRARRGGALLRPTVLVIGVSLSISDGYYSAGTGYELGGLALQQVLPQVGQSYQSPTDDPTMNTLLQRLGQTLAIATSRESRVTVPNMSVYRRILGVFPSNDRIPEWERVQSAEIEARRVAINDVILRFFINILGGVVTGRSLDAAAYLTRVAREKEAMENPKPKVEVICQT